MSANNGLNIQSLFPIVGQRTTSQSVSATIGWSLFGTVSFSLPIVPDYVYSICTIFSVSLSGNPSTLFFYFIVETLNYANIMSRSINYLLFIANKCGKKAK